MAIIVTGCTGSVGAAILELLIKKGIQTYALVRGAGTRNLPTDPLLKELEADVTQKNCGLSNQALTELVSTNIDAVIHSAGLIKFDERFRDELVRVNVGGTTQMLALAKMVAAKHFHHISTAYVVGEAQNPYEASKQLAETVVENSEIPHTIYRPSIVVGDSSNGKIRNYDGFYGFAASLSQIVQSHQRRTNSSEASMLLPINIPCCHDAHLNLISVDWVSKVIVSQIQNPTARGPVFLAHPDPMPLTEVFSRSLPELGIDGINLVPPNTLAPKVPAEFAMHQKLADRMLKKYLPYITEGQHFPVRESFTGIPVDTWQPVPIIDGAALAFLLNSAKAANFGKQASH